MKLSPRQVDTIQRLRATTFRPTSDFAGLRFATVIVLRNAGLVEVGALNQELKCREIRLTPAGDLVRHAIEDHIELLRSDAELTVDGRTFTWQEA